MKAGVLVSLGVAGALLASCGGRDVAGEQQAMRSPEHIQQKTAEALSITDVASVSVSNIELTKSPRGKSLIVVWKAATPDGKSYLCNSDKRLDFPVCEVAP